MRRPAPPAGPLSAPRPCAARRALRSAAGRPGSARSTFPPGRARVSASPIVTGSLMAQKTTGVALEASFARSPAPLATRRSARREAQPAPPQAPGGVLPPPPSGTRSRYSGRRGSQDRAIPERRTHWWMLAETRVQGTRFAEGRRAAGEVWQPGRPASMPHPEISPIPAKATPNRTNWRRLLTRMRPSSRQYRASAADQL